jgi:hypothetical protein
MMKKHTWMMGIALTALVLTLAWPAMAQGRGRAFDNPDDETRGQGYRMRGIENDQGSRPGRPPQGMRRLDGQGPRMIDTTDDGVCDNLEDNLKAGPPPRARRFDGQGPGFVDANGDGFCDNRPARPAQGQRRLDGQGPRMIDTTGDGVCDNLDENLKAGPPPRARRFDGQGPGFADANDDGFCDNRPAGPPPEGRGYGRGQGFGAPPEGRGQGLGAPPEGRGQGRGFRPPPAPDYQQR